MTSYQSVFERCAEQAAFDELCLCVLAGSQLPQLDELLTGVPFYKDEIWADADAFARQVMLGLGPDNDGDCHLLYALAELTVAPRQDDFVHAAEQLEAAVGRPSGKAARAEQSAARCRFYAAVSGHAESVRPVALHAVSLSRAEGRSPGHARSLLMAAVPWMMASLGPHAVPKKWTREAAAEFLAADRPTVVDVRRRTAAADEVQVPDPDPWLLASEGAERDGEDIEAGEDDVDLEPRAVVIAAVGNPQSSEGRRVAGEFRSVLGASRRLVAVPDLVRVRAGLAAELPHSGAVTDAVLAGLVGLPHVGIRPTVLVGPPGSGKSSYAVRLADSLGLPAEVFPCGGVADASLAGTSRRWQSGEPSLPVSLVRTHECANPAVILDEFEKVGTSQQNGSLLDALLALLEPRTARCWRDPYLEAPTDLSHVVWLATANSLDGVPRALRDRCRIIPFPPPRAEHVAALAGGFLARLATERGLHPRWIGPVDGVELTALRRAWSGGSIRSLTRLVEGVLQARERFDVVH